MIMGRALESSVSALSSVVRAAACGSYYLLFFFEGSFVIHHIFVKGYFLSYIPFLRVNSIMGCPLAYSKCRPC